MSPESLPLEDAILLIAIVLVIGAIAFVIGLI